MNAGGLHTTSLVLGYNVVMFALIEIPLVGYLLAPKLTDRAVSGVRNVAGVRARFVLVSGPRSRLRGRGPSGVACRWLGVVGCG